MRTYFLALLASLVSSPLALATEGHLESLTTNGSGCPIQSDLKVPYAFDGQWLTVELNKAFSIKVDKGYGLSLEDSRKNCAITLQLQPPAGYRYAVERVVSWGTYQLSANDQFVGSLNGFFEGDGRTFSSSADAKGPSSTQNYTFDRNFSGSNMIWSECNKDSALTLNAALRVAPSNNNGKYATRSTGSLDRIAFRFVYQKCY